ncbi:uncharacterized protein LOC132564825, partial [Ylistrum balloti]|uniref:uncharacterized protein LOC132564825 n=1 Tax=Ylistrum balloti TaxID=509963 RepID=UPI00290586ED
PYELARQRRATIYAEIIGYATTADAHHITEPDPQGKGAELAVRQALDCAEIMPKMIDYVNAHATGTTIGDQIEMEVLQRIFQENNQPFVSSTKGQTGHLLGAAGALEAIITSLTIQTGILPVNLFGSQPIETCSLNLVPESSLQKPVRYALSNSFGFGGVNTALVFRQPDLTIDHR